MFLQSCRLALQSIFKSKMRAFLTMLGIIIGVGAVTVIVGMGDGMKSYISSSFESMGTNLILVGIMGRGSSRSVDVDEMYDLVEQNPELLSFVSPTVPISGSVKIGGEEPGSTTVTGVGEDYTAIKGFSVSDGRFIQYIDILRRQKICVVGSYLASTYYDSLAVGHTLKVNGSTFTIVGVLNEESDSEEGSTDDAVYIPYSVAAKMSWAGQISGYSFSGASEERITEAKSIIENKLYEVYESADSYNVTSMTEILGIMSEMINVVVIVLGAIAAISLFVGGIGIMNIMLVSVTERTREIGIRKSLGARQRDILQQFVIEAATTSALGGVLGIGFGFLLSSLATRLLLVLADTELLVSPSPVAVLGAFSVSVAIGIVFGYLPARKAAKLNPIDALRYE